MKVVPTTKAFFRALSRILRAQLKTLRAHLEGKRYHTIPLSGGSIYLRFPRLRFDLIGVNGDEGALELSYAEAQELLSSIELACERREPIRVEIGGLSWTTDASVQSTDRDLVVVKCRSPGGRLSLRMSRERLLFACKAFSERFGKGSALSDWANGDH
jgi:hypothetical protein